MNKTAAYIKNDIYENKSRLSNTLQHIKIRTPDQRKVTHNDTTSHKTHQNQQTCHNKHPAWCRYLSACLQWTHDTTTATGSEQQCKRHTRQRTPSWMLKVKAATAAPLGSLGRLTVCTPGSCHAMISSSRFLRSRCGFVTAATQTGASTVRA